MAAEVTPAVDDRHDDFFEHGVAVRDGFLSAARVRDLQACLLLRRARGDFTAARVGADQQLLQRGEIRGDLTCWLAGTLLPSERALLADLERLRQELNRVAFLGLFDLELHYAWYPPGAGYARHVDRLHGSEQRTLSVIVYLNEAWQRGDGGELRLFGTAGDYRDIEPIAGRMVYFLTAGREHAVLPTRCDRSSISGWLRRRD